MGKRYGFGEFQFELVEGWPRAELAGAATDVALDSRGRAYVTVRNPKPGGAVGDLLGGGGHVQVLDPDGRALARWDDFSSPHGVWIGPADEIFVADTGFHTVTKHAPSGEVLLTLGTRGRPGAPGAPFNRPTHGLQAPDGDLLVSDGYGQNRIHRFTAAGEHLRSWGAGEAYFFKSRFGDGSPVGPPATGPGEFNVPHDLAVDRQGRVFVMDRENSRWQVFTLDGELLSICDGVNHPNRVQLDPAGRLIVIGGSGVEVRLPDGTLLGSWGEFGQAPGQFVRGPHGGWLGPDGALYVAEAGANNRLQKFARV